MEKRFDAVVIGTGSAGTAAATQLRERGKSVAIIDERPFGGTCALRGCDPKKVLVAAARVLDEAARWTELGVFDGAPHLRWADLMRFKRTFTDPVPEQRRETFEKAGITALHGRAKFADRQTLIVEDDRIRAEYFVIASGAAELHVAKGDDVLLTSETFMELEAMPKSLIFVGGGYIAFEFAHVAARSGARVTILNDNAEPLHGFDRDAVERLLDVTRGIGIDLQLETPVESVERTERGIAVNAKTKNGARTFEAENGVLAAGRVPDLDALDLDAAGIERTKKGVRVNEYLQSVSNPNVYAAGDAADGGGLPLTPIAGYEGKTAAANILGGNTQKTDYRALATMVYTIPALGTVGVMQGQGVRSGDMSDWYSTRHVAARAGFYKLNIENETGKLLGATILGPHAEEQINVLALAIRRGLKAAELAETLFAYPTGSSDFEYMAE